jgi:hypothetical protein
MIRYSLACEQAHEFESWFPSSEAYDEQASRGFVTCPACGSERITKRIMAPSVARTDRGPRPAGGPVAAAAPAPTPTVPGPGSSGGLALLSEQEQGLRAMLRAFKEHVVRTTEDVGRGFADEARRIHHGEAEARSIRGEASPAEARDLLEEGVEIHALPILPDDRN